MGNREFERQIERNRQRDVEEFLTDAEYEDIRKVYRDHFEKIEELIGRFGPKPSIEDISRLEPALSDKIYSAIYYCSQKSTEPYLPAI